MRLFWGCTLNGASCSSGVNSSGGGIQAWCPDTGLSLVFRRLVYSSPTASQTHNCMQREVCDDGIMRLRLSGGVEGATL
jgi:hypothetical protein